MGHKAWRLTRGAEARDRATRRRAYEELVGDVRRLHAGGASEAHALRSCCWLPALRTLADRAGLDDNARADVVGAIYRPLRLVGRLRILT